MRITSLGMRERDVPGNGTEGKSVQGTSPAMEVRNVPGNERQGQSV